MENASKALLMAGGVLASVIVISLLVILYTNISSLSNAKQQILETEELAKYNAEWESYNRDNLKGVDIITIINKAISVNEKYRAEMDNDDLTMITVYVEITKEVKGYTTTYTWDDSRNPPGYNQSTDNGTVLLNIGNYPVQGKSSDGDIVKFIKETSSTSKKEIIDNKSYKIITTEFDAFKLEDFKCTGILYDNNGQVKEISFEQKK